MRGLNFIQRWLDDRKTDLLTVTITGKDKPTDILSVLERHKRFGDMAMKCDLTIVAPARRGDGQITLSGRKKDLRRFKALFEVYDGLGLV